LGEEEKIKNQGEQGPTLISGCSLEYYIKDVANFFNEKNYLSYSKKGGKMRKLIYFGLILSLFFYCGLKKNV